LALLAASTFQCCGRGIEGTQGPCIRGSEGSVCSAGDIPILCSASSTAYLNIHGHPFCCGPGWTGCSNVCVDQGRRSSILMSGRTCNDVAPQGLRTPGRIQHLDMPWDGQLQRYRFGDRVARVDGLAVPRGRDNLTITATLTPRRDGGVGYGQIWSVLALRFNADPEFIFGIFLGFADSGDRTDIFFILGTDVGLTPEGLVASFNFFANVSVKLTFIRQGTAMFTYANGALLANTTTEEIFDLDSTLAFPLEIGSITIPNDNSGNEILTALNADVSDLSISDTADFPPRTTQVFT